MRDNGTYELQFTDRATFLFSWINALRFENGRLGGEVKNCGACNKQLKLSPASIFSLKFGEPQRRRFDANQTC